MSASSSASSARKGKKRRREETELPDDCKLSPNLSKALHPGIMCIAETLLHVNTASASALSKLEQRLNPMPPRVTRNPPIDGLRKRVRTLFTCTPNREEALRLALNSLGPDSTYWTYMLSCTRNGANAWRVKWDNLCAALEDAYPPVTAVPPLTITVTNDAPVIEPLPYNAPTLEFRLDDVSATRIAPLSIAASLVPADTEKVQIGATEKDVYILDEMRPNCMVYKLVITLARPAVLKLGGSPEAPQFILMTGAITLYAHPERQSRESLATPFGHDLQWGKNGNFYSVEYAEFVRCFYHLRLLPYFSSSDVLSVVKEYLG